MSFRTHIVIADRGWILEKLASEIADRSNHVSFGTEPDPYADLQYYINYSCRRRRVGPVELAFFTHSERDENARKRFFDIAHEVEHAVCMSQRYSDELHDAGVANISTITPGVDLEAYQPKVRIGVVGRTYHTGRKGEALVADVMDVPGIEWRFTGSGWPGESQYVADGRMPEFYNDLDYVLVPALYEGGPMSVLEGLACGVPIISSDVGWVKEYPHIAFDNGDARSLRKVLNGLVDERMKLRKTVEHRSWKAWGENHLELFEHVASKHGLTSKQVSLRGANTRSSLVKRSDLSVYLMTHGGEGKTLGGPSVRVPNTAEKLAELGVTTQLPEEDMLNFPSAEIVHVFNTWPADSAWTSLAQAKQAGKTTVFSPIFLNLTHADTFSRQLPSIYSENRTDKATFEIALKALHHEAQRFDDAPIREPYPGYHDRVRACVDSADHIICLSDYEKACLDKIGAEAKSWSLVHNPVDADKFSIASGDLFKQRFGVEDYILCVGRIEPRKNQLLLAIAARELDLPVIFIGHEGNANYAKLVREAAGENAKFVSRIDPSDDALASAFAGARIFCLPSWSEGAPLAALEAAAAGSNLVLSSLSSEPEYFSEFARFAHPADLDGLKSMLQEAWDAPMTAAKRKKQITSVAKRFNWNSYAENTLSAYETTWRNRPLPTDTSKQTAAPARARIYVDLTTTWHHSGHPTGIARVESECYRALLKLFPERVQPIVWDSRTRRFLSVSIADSLSNTDLDALSHLESKGLAQEIQSGDLLPGSRLLNFGGAWIRNRRYVSAVQALKTQHNLNFSLYVYDLIQLQFRQYYPADSATDFETNLKSLARVADDFLVCSEATQKDLLKFLRGEGQAFKAITRTRLGDMGEQEDPGPEAIVESSELLSSLKDEDFVIYVSSLDLRKNHALLINVWRRLIEERGGNVPKLLFIGRNMWMGEQILHQIECDESLNRSIQMLDNVNDQELRWLYQNALFSVYPSFYEGWGLPVAESLSFGTPCLASNRSSVKEIAPQLTDLLDPYDFRAWVERVRYYLDDRVALQRRSDEINNMFEFVEWDASVLDMMNILDSLPIKPASRQITWPSTVLNFTNSGQKDAISEYACRDEWGRKEPTGCWGLRKRNPIHLTVKRPPAEQTLAFRLIISALARPNSKRKVTIEMSGRSLDVFALNREFVWLDVQLDPEELQWDETGFADVELVLDMAEVFSPNDISDSIDDRQLGPMIQSLAFAHSTKQLDAILPSVGYKPAQKFEDYQAENPRRRQTASNMASHVQSPTPTEIKKLLGDAAALLETPKRLPSTNLVFRIISFIRLDRLVLAIYRRMLARTHESLRRIITALSKLDQRS